MTLFFPSHGRTQTAVTSTVMVMTTSASVPTEGAISRDGGVTDRLVHANERYAAAFSDPGMDARPVLHVAVVACMDARLDLHAALGLELGDCHTIRNAGGVVTDDVIRSLTISQRKLGTRDVLVVQHAGCGLGTFTDEDFSEELAREVGMRPPWRTHAFRDPATSVRRDMAQLRHDPFLHPDTRVRGFVLDIESFDLEEIFVD